VKLLSGILVPIALFNVMPVVPIDDMLKVAAPSMVPLIVWLVLCETILSLLPPVVNMTGFAKVVPLVGRAIVPLLAPNVKTAFVFAKEVVVIMRLEFQVIPAAPDMFVPKKFVLEIVKLPPGKLIVPVIVLLSLKTPLPAILRLPLPEKTFVIEVVVALV